MTYRLIKEEAFYVTGLRRCYETVGEGEQDIPLFWDSFNHSDYHDTLISLIDPEESRGLLGVCIPKEGTAYDYLIGVATDDTDVSHIEGLETILIPATDWVVFQAKGRVPIAIRETYQEIYQRFFPSTSYKPARLPDFESYPIDQDPHSEDHVTDIWVPIIKEKTANAFK